MQMSGAGYDACAASGDVEGDAGKRDGRGGEGHLLAARGLPHQSDVFNNSF